MERLLTHAKSQLLKSRNVFILLALFFTMYANAQDVGLTITTDQIPDAIAGRAYSFTLQSQGGTPPYKWSLSRSESSPYPFGFSLTEDGVISGTPPVSEKDIIYHTPVMVTDADGNTTSKLFDFKISGVAILAENSGGKAVLNFIQDGSYGLIEGNDKARKSFITDSPIDVSAVNKPAPQEVYQSILYSEKPFFYTLTGLNKDRSPRFIDGNQYVLRLHFAETIYTQAGQRKFNVSVNGENILSDFDIIAEAGAPNKAIIKEFVVTAHAKAGLPSINLAFENGSAGEAALNGLEVYSSDFPINNQSIASNENSALIITTDSLPTATAGQKYSVSLMAEGGRAPYSWSLSRSESSPYPYGFSLTKDGVISGTPPVSEKDIIYHTPVMVTDADGNTTSKLFDFKISGVAILAENSGGKAVLNFIQDGSYGLIEGNDKARKSFITDSPIDVSAVNKPAPQEVYQSILYSSKPFFYTLTGLNKDRSPRFIDGNQYVLRLHFAETIYTQAGQRKFNVSVNGEIILTDFDIIAEAGGPNIAIIKEFVVTAHAKAGLPSINLAFENGSAGEAALNGLEVYSSDFPITTQSSAPDTSVNTASTHLNLAYKIYPNPTGSALAVESSILSTDQTITSAALTNSFKETFEIKIYNPYGHLIKVVKSIDGKVRTDLSDVQDGLYPMQIFKNGNLVEVQQILVRK